MSRMIPAVRHFLLSLAAAWALLSASAQTPTALSIVKSAHFTQVSASELEARGADITVAADFAETPAADLTVQLRSPAGTLSSLTRGADGKFKFTRSFATTGELEREFPDDLYGLVTTSGAGTKTLTFLLTSGGTVSPVLITNFAALQTLTETSATLFWQPVRGAGASDSLSLSVTRADGTVLYSSPSDLRADQTSSFLGNLSFDAVLTGHLTCRRVGFVGLNGGLTRLAAGRGFEVEFPLHSDSPEFKILYQPVSQVARPGDDLAFTMVATGLGPLHYQWKKDGVLVPGATGNELRLTKVQAAQAGSYVCVVTGPTGQITSTAAGLAVGAGLTYSLWAGVPGEQGSADGPKGSAKLHAVSGMTIDAAGNFYLVETANACIRKISSDGMVSTLAGLPGALGYIDGPAAAARFNNPHSIVVDRAGNLYVTESGNYTVRKITPAGMVSTLAGGVSGAADGMGAAARFRAPAGIAIDPDGNLVVADTYNHTIRKITPAGLVTTFAGAAGQAGFIDAVGPAARLSLPLGVTFDAAGVLFFTDAGNGAIRKATRDGSVTTFFASGSSSGSNFKSVVVDRDGYVLLVDSGGATGSVVRFTPDGIVSAFGWPRYAEFGSNYYRPSALALDASGQVYVSDLGNATILKLTFVAGAGDPGIRIPVAPPSHLIPAGGSALLSVAATGPGLVYQWRRNGVWIVGATDSRYYVPAVNVATAGVYTVVVSNAAGSMLSPPATVSLAGATDTGRLVNLSIRSQAGTDAQTLIVGIAIGGGPNGTARPVLLRAVGPGLSSFGVTGALPDPSLTVYRGSQVVAFSDNWDDTAGTLAGVFASLGAFPLASGSLDAAVKNDLAPASYSVHVTGKGGASGLVLAEIYDAVGASASPFAPRLTNLSARTAVGRGANVLIAGFVVGGTVSKTLLVRAAGPSLSSFGVTAPLSDPLLKIYAGNQVIASNDNWDRDSLLQSLSRSVGAFELASTRDSALVVTLAPGTYTAEVSGVGEATGVALMELYELP